ncbi:peptidoglycan-binding protein LysM [Nocardioides gansuensis]|uniref:Peptidoglycan-binding protein LysM n=1 Tax=Nocardioides gansuensis TaxID=2138300 RepID=A0A2T8F5K4_9ACTN|nr:LysM peptidoglycan-binding domain-containing protein [Nocardioides gansuensis]PVG80986.1 peptidoglycan-binding protein LysM [Nocardioides gansuensis]
MSTMTITPSFASTVRATRRPQQPSSVRLTRRGRLVVFVAALMLVLMAGFFLGSGAVGTGEAGKPEPTEIVMVGTGDTLWGIAAELAEDGEVRSMMREIQELNALDSVSLTAGQRLRVPLSE